VVIASAVAAALRSAGSWSEPAVTSDQAIIASIEADEAIATATEEV
jgi:hypothetical protein